MSAYFDYDVAMRLPEGKKCGDCIHVDRCVRVLGCTKPERTSCDFFPNKFRESKKVSDAKVVKESVAEA